MKIFMLILFLLGSTSSFANQGQRGGERPPENGTPPQEAITACENQKENSTCEMTTPRGDTLSGTCIYTPDKKYFVCMPKDRMRNN